MDCSLTLFERRQRAWQPTRIRPGLVASPRLPGRGGNPSLRSGHERTPKAPTPQAMITRVMGRPVSGSQPDSLRGTRNDFRELSHDG